MEKKTINLGEVEITATINGKPANLIAGDNLTVTINGNISINVDQLNNK